MFVSEIEIEIKIILSNNLEAHHAYSKYYKILNYKNNYSTEKCNHIIVLDSKKMTNETEGNTNRFDIKKNLAKYLRYKFGESVRNRGNKLYIKKLLICENYKDKFNLYTQLMNNLYQYLNCYDV